jgi:citrate lyase beta subunit
MSQHHQGRVELIPELKPIRRSLLFMPGDSLRKITKATQLDVDSVIMDLEDGVALNRKEEARRTISEALRSLEFGRRERLVRLSAPVPPAASYVVESFPALDFEATLEARPDGYVIPKVELAEQVQNVDHYLSQAEQARGWPAQSIRLLVVVETARGIMNLAEIAQSSRRLDALMFGAEDFAADSGAQRTKAGWEVFYARSALVTAAAAYRLQAIDMVFVDLKDMAGLEQECLFGRQLGFEGKLAIHPGQLETINRVFAPSPAELEQAQRVVQANQANQSAGLGAFELDGKMVDMPVVRAAERVLARAKQAGLLDNS